MSAALSIIGEQRNQIFKESKEKIWVIKRNKILDDFLYSCKEYRNRRHVEEVDEVEHSTEQIQFVEYKDIDESFTALIDILNENEFYSDITGILKTFCDNLIDEIESVNSNCEAIICSM